MTTYQYVQNDWSPTIYALVLLITATLFVVGMLLSMRGATREQRGFTARHAGGARRRGPLTH
jgi:hypothetical protein